MPGRHFHRFHTDDPMREAGRAMELEHVRGMKKLAQGHFDADGRPKDEDWCSCVDWVIEMADMIEKLHLRIDELDPDSVSS